MRRTFSKTLDCAVCLIALVTFVGDPQPVCAQTQGCSSPADIDRSFADTSYASDLRSTSSRATPEAVAILAIDSSNSAVIEIVSTSKLLP